jgi:hypothetical protein
MSRKKSYFRSSAYKKLFSKCILIILSVTAAGVIVYGICKWYTVKHNKAAQKALALDIQSLEQAKQNIEIDKIALIEKLEKDFQENKNSALAPYFLAFKGTLLEEQGDYTQALHALEEAVKKLSPGSEQYLRYSSFNHPLYYLYATKLALLKLDAVDQKIVADGIESLQTLANSTKNQYRDMALYWSGLYAFENNNDQDARKWWQELTTVEPQSPWAQLAQEKLASLI